MPVKMPSLAEGVFFIEKQRLWSDGRKHAPAVPVADPAPKCGYQCSIQELGACDNG
jgi:hypothetical protein